MSFSSAIPPARAGDYSRFAVKRSSTIPPSTGSIVAIPLVDDWGPLKTPVLLNSFEEYLQVFGAPTNIASPSPGYVAAYNAFRGVNADRPGAGSLLAYRMGDSSVAKATHALAAGATSPAITFTAAHEGVRGNQFKVEVVANAADSTNKRDIRFYDGATKIDEYKGYGSADIVKLLTDVNARSTLIVASGATNGTKLDLLAASAFTGGNSGTSLISSDWLAAVAALESQQFGYLVPFDLTDTSIQASLVAWAIDLNGREKSKRFFLLEGGALGESYSTAQTRAAAANNENVVTFGVGSYHDSALGLDLSTSQLAPRLAGILSSRGGRQSLSMAHLEDITILSGPTDTEILNSLSQGVVVVSLGPGGVRFEKGVTTFTDGSPTNLGAANADKPFGTYSRIKYVTTMQAFERENREANETGDILGDLPVNKDTREELVSKAQARLDRKVLDKEIQAGAKVGIAPGSSDDDEYIGLEWVGKFSRSLEQVRNVFYLS